MVGSGDSFSSIILLWLPEMLTQFVFIILPPLLDSFVVASLKSTAVYGALGTANNFVHVLLKLAEAIPIASVAIIGRYNGAKQYDKCGKALGDAFWVTILMGLMQFFFIFMAASSIYRLLGVPEEMVILGTPFLRLRAAGVFLVFITLGLLYFLRAIKNTKAPMVISMIGVSCFVFSTTRSF